MKKLLAILMATLMLLASCSSAPAETTTSETAAPDGNAADVAATATEDITDKYRGEQVVIYGRFLEADAKWLSDTVWPEFTETYGVEVVYKTFEDPAELSDMLELDKESGIATVFMANDAVTSKLVEDGLVAPTSSYDIDGAYSSLFTDAAIEGTMVNGEQYYLPMYISAYSMLYSVEAVNDAVANWEGMKDAISATLEEYNGYGLPDDYALEADPNEWDNYDLAVVGQYWANTEYNGTTAPRIAHRARRYDGTYLEYTAKAHQLGATHDDILAMNTDPIVDLFEWENYYANSGVYLPTMWEEEWSGGGIYQAMADGNVYLAFMHSQDAFTVHGTGTVEMPGYLANPDDMGFSTSIDGASLEITDGAPARTSTASSTKWIWNIGVAESSPNKDLAFEFAKWITAGKDEYVSRWLSSGGIYIPLKTVAADPAAYVSEDWMINVYEVSAVEIDAAYYSPLIPQFPEIGNLFIDAWTDIVRDGNNADIRGTLNDVYAPAAAEILQ